MLLCSWLTLRTTADSHYISCFYSVLPSLPLSFLLSTFLCITFVNCFGKWVTFCKHLSPYMEYFWSHCCCSLVAKSCPVLLWSHEAWPARLLCPWDFPGKNTGVGCHFFLQGIFLAQGLNLHLLCLLHCRQTLYLLSHCGKRNADYYCQVTVFRSNLLHSKK